MPSKRPRPATLTAHLGEERHRYHGAAAPPLFATTTFMFPGPEEAEAALDGGASQFFYTRRNNPTVRMAETKLAALEGTEDARCFGSGMGAIAAAILSQVKAGDHVVCVRNVYGPTYNLLTNWLPRFGVETTFVAGADPAEWAAAARPGTRLFYLESPTSLTFKLQDVRAVAAIARERGIVTAIDNSWATPLFMQPAALGVDLVIHTATKYLAGHSDVVAGVVAGSRERLQAIATAERELLGAVLGPFEAWLLVRGLRTLTLRMDRHQASGLQVAAWLERQPQVQRVLHPGLPSHPQHGLHRQQCSGAAGLFAVELNADYAGVSRFLRKLHYFGLGVSWGGFESLAWAPAITLRKTLNAEAARAAGVPYGLVRLHVGLEDPEELIADLDGALAAL